VDRIGPGAIVLEEVVERFHGSERIGAGSGAPVD
jgi:hypothetical protein